LLRQQLLLRSSSSRANAAAEFFDLSKAKLWV
jgi:hypothetical protein